MPVNYSDSFTVTGAVVTGLPTATLFGIGSGLSQSAIAAQNAAVILSERSGQRDSILQALNVLFNDQENLDHSIFQTFLKELREGFAATNDSVALIIRNGLIGVLSAISHLAQVPIDSLTVIQEIAKALTHSDIPSDKLQQAISAAFLMDINKKDASASIGVVTQICNAEALKTENEVNKVIHIEQNSHAKLHAEIAGSTSVGGVNAVSFAIPSVVATLTNLIGQVFREASAVHHFSALESASHADENNIYVASGNLAKATANSDSQATDARIKAFEEALCDNKVAADLLSNQVVTTPIATALARLVVLSTFGETAKIINRAALASSEGRIKKALVDATAQNPSAGVDRINRLHSNLCSLSNIMRLCADNLGGANLLESGVEISELVSGRAVSILSSHAGQLAEALFQLIDPLSGREENKRSATGVDSSIKFADPEKEALTAGKIKELLDKIEAANGPVIPHLNDGMASQLNMTAKTAVSCLVATHSLFVNPIAIPVKASKKAVNTAERDKNEALMASLPGFTQLLNEIQAFSHNFMREMKNEVKDSDSKGGNLLSTHEALGVTSASVYRGVCTIALICDEMLSMCRSLTLIDQERLKAVSERVKQIETKKELADASEQIAWDSHLGENSSAIHAISALRLTLSHTGIALIKIGLALSDALKNDLDTVQRNLHLHTLQRTLIVSGGAAVFTIADGALLTTGGISAAPLSLNGAANWSQVKVHTTDAHLHPAQTHESENFSRDSASLQAIGFASDHIAGTISNILKVLAQGGLIGLDTVLKLAKALEILSLHRDSLIALKLESQELSLPNGLLNNLLEKPVADSSAGVGGIFMNILANFQSLDLASQSHTIETAQHKLQDALDEQIASVASLEDDEETERLDKKGLRALFKVVIRLLAPNHEAAFYSDLVRRINYGGISLSSYHTEFGAYDNTPARDLQFAAQFANEDDASGVIRKFICCAKKDLSLFKNFHIALPKNERSAKAEAIYQYVFESLYQHYKQMKMRDIAEHSGSRKRIPNRAEFLRDLGLVHQPENEANEDAAPALN